MVDHDEGPVGTANWGLSELEDMVSSEVLVDIAVLEDNAPPDVIPDRLLEEDLLARHGYCCCCYCCKRYLSQTVDVVDAVACPEDDHTESRNFFPVSCSARVLLGQRAPVQEGMSDVEELSNSKDGSTVGRQDVLVPRWNYICDLVKDHDLMIWSTSYEVQFFEHRFLVNFEVGTVGIAGCIERDSPGMVDILS